MQDSLSPNNEKCHMILKMSYWTATVSVVEGCHRILKEIIRERFSQPSNMKYFYCIFSSTTALQVVAVVFKPSVKIIIFLYLNKT